MWNLYAGGWRWDGDVKLKIYAVDILSERNSDLM